MPRIDLRCEQGHEREAYVPLSLIDGPLCCPECGRPAEIFLSRPPAMDPGTHSEEIYRQHNVTRTTEMYGGAVVARPNPPEQQCQCGDCSKHRRRSLAVAAPGREV